MVRLSLSRYGVDDHECLGNVCVNLRKFISFIGICFLYILNHIWYHWSFCIHIYIYTYIYGISSFYYRNMTTCSTDHPNVVEHLSSMNVMILSILWFASFCWPKGTNYSHVFDFHSDFNRSYSDRLQVKNCLLAFRNGQATYSNWKEQAMQGPWEERSEQNMMLLSKRNKKWNKYITYIFVYIYML